TARGYHRATETPEDAVRRVAHLRAARAELEAAGHDAAALSSLLESAEKQVDAVSAELLASWPRVVEDYSGDEMVVRVRDKEIRTKLTRKTLSGNEVRRVSLPRYEDDGTLLRFL
ncbi:methylmalonyl-CoA mutase, partial [Actinosynnema sp. NPDC023658]